MGKTFLNLVIIFFVCNLYSQKIIFNKNSIHLNELLEISVALDNEKIEQISVFPELKGFVKKDSIRKNHIYMMQYQPTQTGSYSFPNFKIKVNQKTASHPRFTVKVTSSSHFSNFFHEEAKPVEDKNTYTRESLSFKPKDDAFIVTSHPQKSVYVGEEVLANISLYILEKKSDKYEFANFEESYKILTKDFKPSNCLEENIPIEKIENEYVQINGQKYLKYKLYESVFFPLLSKPVIFKSLTFPMLKSKMLGIKKDTIWLKSTESIVKVKDLPKQQLGENVNVGKFVMSETISNNRINVGQSVNYKLKIFGEGNVRNLTKPIIVSDKHLDVYESKFVSSIQKNNGKISGTVDFNYHITCNSAGKIALADHIKWIYFNPETGAFDTLQSRISLHATGEQANNKLIAANQTDKFYQLIGTQSAKLRNADSNDQFKKWANIGFIIMLSFTLLFIFVGRKNKSR